jgi:hypothetical protein
MPAGSISRPLARVLFCGLAALALALPALTPARRSVAAEPGADAAANSNAPVSAIERLKAAQFYSAVEGDWSLPYGRLKLSEGQVAVLGMERGSALLLGGLELTLDKLPAGQGSLNLFQEIQTQRGVAEAGKLSLRGSAAYLSTGLDGGVREASGKRLDGGRAWDALSAGEQEQFKRYFLQAYSDGFFVEGSLSPRPAAGKELLLSFWGQPAWEQDELRYDLRVNAEGSEVTVEDYYRGSLMYQWPWAPEEGEADSGITFSSLQYSYSFAPGSGESAGRLDYAITANISLATATSSLSLASAPWLGLPKVSDGRRSLTASRAKPGQSAWALNVQGDFRSGPQTLYLTGSCDVPRSFAAVGYGGAYRFDMTPLWPGEDQAVQVSIALSLPGEGWSYIATNGAELGAPAEAGSAALLRDRAYSWQGSTRNCMVVATQFPLTEVDTAWGKLSVYAPAGLSASVPEMGSVKAIGPCLAYYEQLWGPRRSFSASYAQMRSVGFSGAVTDAQAPVIREQAVFLLPDEEGVQAFEDAGLVFILGGEESYGGSGQSLPVMAHELAHLWWGHGVSGPRWFIEGMANYAAAKFLEQYYGPGGMAEGQGEPYGYRRYMVNFALSHALPLGLAERDSHDDSGAIYHNSAGFLLTADERRSAGLDPLLKQLYGEHEYAPSLSQSALRGEFASFTGGLSSLWDKYVERGELEFGAVEDETYRQAVLTPEREKYVKLLRWLVPMRRKAAAGDFEGAIYCGEQALAFRSEPKDYLYLAELHFKNGEVQTAREIIEGGQAGSGLDSVDGLKATWLLARIYREQGDRSGERQMLEHVAELGPQFGLLSEAEQATERLKEL